MRQTSRFVKVAICSNVLEFSMSTGVTSYRDGLQLESDDSLVRIFDS